MPATYLKHFYLQFIIFNCYNFYLYFIVNRKREKSYQEKRRKQIIWSEGNCVWRDERVRLWKLNLCDYVVHHEYGGSRYYTYLSIRYMHNIDILRNIFLPICVHNFTFSSYFFAIYLCMHLVIVKCQFLILLLIIN